jgi:iron complex outermembrane receptor protein/vitamin B12 transporter
MSVCLTLRRSSAFASGRVGIFRKLFCSLAFLTIIFASGITRAASIRGIVTDPSGARITRATVNLVYNGQVIATAISTSDGSFQLLTGVAGRFYLVISASTFRQIETPGFYAGQADSIERNLVLEPEWTRQSIVVTATGVPTPQAQTSEATNVLGPLDLDLRDDLTSALRLMPGTAVVQSGQMGAQTSLFIRGGNSDANKILVDGVDAGDMGGQFDFGTLSTTVVQSAEVYRGTNSSLYGADAGSGVISLSTPHGTTSFPSFIFRGDAGSFYTSHEELEAAGAHNKLDYLGAFSWLQTGNDLANDEFHVATSTANAGWQPSASTQIRATLHYGVDGTGVPNTWDFYRVADDATEKDQDIFLSASADNQTTADFHNSIRYGLTRKREQYSLWKTSGGYQPYNNYCFGPAYLGNLVTITGANGYSARGQAVLDCTAGQAQNVNNRDQLGYQGDYRFTPHLTALIGFHYENERGSEPNNTYYPAVNATNYDYLAAVHGDYKGRFFYTLGGSLEKYSLFGVQTSPRAGVSYYALRPKNGVFSGTKVLFNFGDAVREPKLTDEDGSLYAFLEANGGQSAIQQFHISQLSPPTTRTYEGGIEQAFLSDHLVLRTSYFHSEFGKEPEYIGLALIPELLPNLTPSQQNALGKILVADLASEFTVNSEAFRVQGMESSVEGGIGRHIFLRGGYTYLDSVVQRSFSNDEQSTGIAIPTYNRIPVGAYSPLQGARSFRRPPHTGFFTATYSEGRLTAALTSAFASRSDDSTYLEGADAEGANSLLLPNRNLDYGFAKIDLGGSYKLLDWLEVYIRQENLANNQHIAPIGYPSLPMTFRLGLRIAVGKESSK